MRGAEVNKTKTGKITAVYRKKFCIHVENVTKEKANGQSVPVPIHPSNVEIIDLCMNKDRTKILKRKDREAAAQKGKGKYTEETAAAAAMAVGE